MQLLTATICLSSTPIRILKMPGRSICLFSSTIYDTSRILMIEPRLLEHTESHISLKFSDRNPISHHIVGFSHSSTSFRSIIVMRFNVLNCSEIRLMYLRFLSILGKFVSDNHLVFLTELSIQEQRWVILVQSLITIDNITRVHRMNLFIWYRSHYKIINVKWGNSDSGEGTNHLPSQNWTLLYLFNKHW